MADEPKDQNKEPGPGPEPGSEPKNAPKTYTEDEVKALKNKLLTELEAIKAKADLTEEQKKEFEERIQTLRKELMTKEQLAQEEKKKLEKEYKKKLTDLEQQASQWKQRYEQATITRAILDAAAKHDAYNPEQLVEMLAHKTKLVEELDEDGKPTGSYIPKLTIIVTDEKTKEQKELELPVHEAIGKLKEREEYGNLFKGKGVGGLNLTTRNKSLDIASLAKDPKAYREARKKGLI